MIAFLGMYDLPPLRAANDAFWDHIREALGSGPAALTRDRDVWEIWRAPDLVFAQTCGLPYRARLQGAVSLVGTPDYALPGCPPGYYNSVLVARRGSDAPLAELARGTFAYNEALSQSGWAGPVTHLAARGIALSRLVETGGHVASAHAVLAGKADLAGLDALTWALLQEHDPEMAQLRVVETTEPVPGLPYITGLQQNAEAVFDATALAIERLSDDLRRALHLNGMVRIPGADYLAVPTPPPPER